MFLSGGVDSSNKTLQMVVKLVWTKYKTGWLGIATSWYFGYGLFLHLLVYHCQGWKGTTGLTCFSHKTICICCKVSGKEHQIRILWLFLIWPGEYTTFIHVYKYPALVAPINNTQHRKHIWDSILHHVALWPRHYCFAFACCFWEYMEDLAG